MPMVPEIRVAAQNGAPVRRDRDYVLYWMIAARRTSYSVALDRAVQYANELALPLVVFEPLRSDYPYACPRFHRFVIDGMRDQAAVFAKAEVLYLPYVERAHGEGKGMLALLASRAAVVVTDDFPAFFLRRMVRAAGTQLDVRLEAVDGNGLMPLRGTPNAFPLAHAFRRYVQKNVAAHLRAMPSAAPLDELVVRRRPSLPRMLDEARYRRMSPSELEDPTAVIATVASHAPHFDVTVGEVEERGGEVEAERRFARFVAKKLASYHESRSHPDDDVASGLSPYLHFGHIGTHRIFAKLVDRTGWTRARLAPKPHGSRDGWWNLGDAEDSFLDELVTWRELGFVRCHHTDDYETYDGLPPWARASLAEHASDPRPERYTRAELEAAKTSDEVWNAAQRQLVREGRIQNYVRMLWGKKVLEWSATPREGFDTLIYLNDKYALDGRDPNTYTNIGWVFGAYDRAWGPERPIFGKIRFMTSAQTRRKLRIEDWLTRFGPTRRA